MIVPGGDAPDGGEGSTVMETNIVAALRARCREEWEALDGAQAEVARLHAVVTEQVIRISALLDAVEAGVGRE